MAVHYCVCYSQWLTRAHIVSNLGLPFLEYVHRLLWIIELSRAERPAFSESELIKRYSKKAFMGVGV